VSLGHNLAREERARDRAALNTNQAWTTAVLEVHVNLLMNRLIMAWYIDNECSRCDLDTSKSGMTGS